MPVETNKWFEFGVEPLSVLKLASQWVILSVAVFNVAIQRVGINPPEVLWGGS